jgi:hypothetical protein
MPEPITKVDFINKYIDKKKEEIVEAELTIRVLEKLLSDLGYGIIPDEPQE